MVNKKRFADDIVTHWYKVFRYSYCDPYSRGCSQAGTGFLSYHNPNRFCLACHSHLSNHKRFLNDDVTY